MIILEMDTTPPPPPQDKSSLKKTTKLHQTLFLGVFLDNEKTDSGWGDNYCICILKRKIVWMIQKNYLFCK